MLIPRATNKATKECLVGIKKRATMDFQLEANNTIIYRKPEKANGKVFGLRYAPRTDNAFRIIANIHCQFDHAGIRQTWDKGQENYYGICESNVKWVLRKCVVCAYDGPNTTEAIIQPIISERCNDRIQIDLMDFRSNKDGDYSWIIQIKDHFSQYVWLHPPKEKKSEGVASVMANWFMYNGYPKIL